MTPPLLIIEIKKVRDAPPSLACVRRDGSRTWARVHPFFPAHDLTHCAVESVFGLERAFFGLVASGWELDYFAQPGLAGRQPPEALWAEHVVGLLERDAALGAAALNQALAASLPAGTAALPIPTDDDVRRVRALRSDLVGRWAALPAGETLRVEFPATSR